MMSPKGTWTAIALLTGTLPSLCFGYCENLYQETLESNFRERTSGIEGRVSLADTGRVQVRFGNVWEIDIPGASSVLGVEEAFVGRKLRQFAIVGMGRDGNGRPEGITVAEVDLQNKSLSLPRSLSIPMPELIRDFGFTRVWQAIGDQSAGRGEHRLVIWTRSGTTANRLYSSGEGAPTLTVHRVDLAANSVNSNQIGAEFVIPLGMSIKDGNINPQFFIFEKGQAQLVTLKVSGSEVVPLFDVTFETSPREITEVHTYPGYDAKIDGIRVFRFDFSVMSELYDSTGKHLATIPARTTLR